MSANGLTHYGDRELLIAKAELDLFRTSPRVQVSQSSVRDNVVSFYQSRSRGNRYRLIAQYRGIVTRCRVSVQRLFIAPELLRHA